MNNKGFTMVELLATMAVLVVLMLLAIPNIVGIVDRNKNKTYVEDAKKLVTLAEYKVSSNPNVKPNNNEGSYCYYLHYLDTTNELNDSPNGGVYDKFASYVKVTNTNGVVNYNVQLVETKGSYKGGIKETNSDNLYGDDTSSLITTSISNECVSTSSPKKYYYDRDDNPSNSPIRSASGIPHNGGYDY